MSTRHTYEMGIVGNCAYLAHVDLHARIVWMCLPRFDSSFVFGHLLDAEQGGSLAVESVAPVKATQQSYEWNTNVLVTEIETLDGKYRVTDCAPRFYHHGTIFKPLMLIRKIEPIGTTPRVKLICRPRGGYGTTLPRMNQEGDHLRYDLGDDVVRLHTNVPFSYVASEREFVLSEPKWVVLTWGSPFESKLEDKAEEYLRRTTDYWQHWVLNCAIGRFYQSHIIRSALVLKLHQFEDTGAIIASGTMRTTRSKTTSTGR
jgi:GH15 family glucan-1,4-alpha-glucosidase